MDPPSDAGAAVRFTLHIEATGEDRLIGQRRVLATDAPCMGEGIGPHWSVSGRFVAFEDDECIGGTARGCGGEFRIRIYDTQTSSARDFVQPCAISDCQRFFINWAPDADLLIVPTGTARGPRLLRDGSSYVASYLEQSVYEAASGAVYATPKTSSVGFIGRSLLSAVTDDGAVHIIDPRNGRELNVWMAGGTIIETAFVGDAPVMAAASMCGLFIAHTSLPGTNCLPGFTPKSQNVDGVLTISWSPDGSRLAVATGDPWRPDKPGIREEISGRGCRLRVYELPVLVPVIDVSAECYAYVEPRLSWSGDGETLHVYHIDVGP